MTSYVFHRQALLTIPLLQESFIIVHQRGFLIATVIVSSLMAVLMAVLLASQTMGILYVSRV